MVNRQYGVVDSKYDCSFQFVRLNAGYVVTQEVRDRVSRKVRWRTILLLSSSIVSRFHYDKIGITPPATLCSLCVPKIIKFYKCVQKYKLAPFNLAHTEGPWHKDQALPS